MEGFGKLSVDGTPEKFVVFRAGHGKSSWRENRGAKDGANKGGDAAKGGTGIREMKRVRIGGS